MCSVWKRICMIGIVALCGSLAHAQEPSPITNATGRIETLNELHGKLDAVMRQLNNLHDLYGQNPKIAEVKRAAYKARAAADAAVAELRRADAEAEAAVEEYDTLQESMDKLERQRSVIRARIERTPDMVEARRVRDKARAEADALERAALAEYEALYRAKLTNNTEWARIDAELYKLQRREYALRHRAKELDRRATQAPEVLAAASALARAERARDERLREAVCVTVEGKVALGVMEKLERHRRELERQLGNVRKRVAEGPQLAELRETMAQCKQRRYDGDAAYRRLVARKLNGIEEAVELRALLHGVHSGLRDRLEARLAEIQKTVEKDPDVVAASKARTEAGRAYETAYTAYEKKLTTAMAAHPDAAALNAVLQEFRDATYKVRELQTTAQRDNPRVMAACEAQKQAAQALKQTREAVREKAEQIVANDPEGAALLKQQGELESAIRELEGK